MIACPFCLGEIVGEAVACRHCGRDVSGHMYLIRRIDVLEREFADLSLRLGAQTDTLVIATTASAASAIPAGEAGTVRWWVEDIGTAVVPAVLMLLAHHFLILSQSLPRHWLLLATILIPLPFGYLAIVRSRRALDFWLAAFYAASIATVLAMHADTAIAIRKALPPGSGVEDQTPLMPASHAEWLEDAQFSLSVFLGFMTGMLVGIGDLRRRFPYHPKLALITANLATIRRMLLGLVSEATVTRINKYATSVGGILSAAGALYLGLRNI